MEHRTRQTPSLTQEFTNALLQLFAHNVLSNRPRYNCLDLSFKCKVDSIDLDPQLWAAVEFRLEDVVITQRASQQRLNYPRRAFDVWSELDE